MVKSLNFFGKVYVGLSTWQGFKRWGFIGGIISFILSYAFMIILYPLSAIVGVWLFFKLGLFMGCITSAT